MFVSHKFSTSSYLHLCQKWYRCGLSVSVVLQRTARFLNTVYVMLEEYNNFLPNKTWLGDKHISIVFE